MQGESNHRDVRRPLEEELAEGVADPILVDQERVVAVPAVKYYWFVSAHAAGRVTCDEPLLLYRKKPVRLDADHQERSG